MTQTTPQRVSLWRATWHDIKSNWRLFAPWAAGFALINFMIYAVMEAPSQETLNAMFAQWGASDSTSLPDINTFKTGGGFGILPDLLHVILALISSYVYPALYLRESAPAWNPQMNTRNFFYWFWQKLLAWLIMLSPLLVCGAIIPVLTMSGNVPVAAIGSFLLFSAGLLGSVYLYGRYALVTPLAILNRAPVRKTSWEMSHGKVNRLLWQMFILLFWLGLTLFAIVAFLVAVGVGVWTLAGLSDVKSHLAPILYALNIVDVISAQISLVFLTAFYVKAYTVLIDETGSQA